MDSEQFDGISRSLATLGTRRGIMRLLGALPLVGVLMTVRDDEQVGATPHRKSRHGTHRDQGEITHDERHQPRVSDEGKGKHKGKRKKRRKTPAGCVPQSAAQTCAGRCGQVPNNCGTMLDCGACSCPLVCPVCQTCNTTTGHCEANPVYVGQICGAPGQVCQTNGACVCDDASCPAGQVCNGLACCKPVPDATTCGGKCGNVVNNCRQTIDCTAVCANAGCCAGDGSCQPGTGNAACGPVGGTCDICPALDVCFNRDCCTPVNPSCEPTSCNQTNNCGQLVNCCGAAGAATPGCEGNACCEQGVGSGTFCSATVPCCQMGQAGSRSCVNGDCCVNSGFPTAQANQCCSGVIQGNFCT